MEWNTEFIAAAIYEIAKAIVNKATDVIQREIEKYDTEVSYN